MTALLAGAGPRHRLAAGTVPRLVLRPRFARARAVRGRAARPHRLARVLRVAVRDAWDLSRVVALPALALALLALVVVLAAR